MGPEFAKFANVGKNGVPNASQRSESNAKMDVLDVRNTPLVRTSTNQRVNKRRMCNLKMIFLDVRKTPLERTSTNRLHKKNVRVI